MNLSGKGFWLGLALVMAFPTAARADRHHRDHRIVVRRPVVVHRRPRYRIHVAPPAVRREVRIRAPSPRHIWIPGYWGWRHRHHVWVRGRWRLPPRAGRIWIAPRWVNEGGAWVFYEGYWGTPGPPQPQAAPPAVQEEEWDVDAPPPPAQVEEPPPAPSPQYFWVSGYWGWNGRRHVWRPGHWVLRRPGYIYVPGRWAVSGRRWHWHPARWRQE